MLNKIHPNIIRQGFFLAFLVFVGIIIAKQMFFMLGAFLGAITLYVLMYRGMIQMVVKWKWKKWFSALLLIVFSIFILIIPLVWLTSFAIDTLKPIIQNPEPINKAFTQMHEYLLTNFSLDILNSKNTSVLNSGLLSFAQNTIGGTMSGVGNLFVMYIILYFMLIESMTIEKWLRHNVPFKNKNVQTSISEFRNLVYSNALGIPLVALVQGLVGFFGYWIFGVEQFVIMGLLTAICSLIPMVGAMILYIPLAIFELSLGHTWQGVGIILWGVLLIGSVDNVARLWIQKKMADVHPLITLFGAFIGINLFGFLGVIFGPLVLSMFFLFVRIYLDEFGTAEANKTSVTVSEAPPLTEDGKEKKN